MDRKDRVVSFRAASAAATAQIMKNIRPVLDAQKNTPCIKRRVFFQKRLLGVYFSQKQGVYLAKNRAYIWPKPT
jgi:hypothetical protein